MTVSVFTLSEYPGKSTKEEEGRADVCGGVKCDAQSSQNSKKQIKKETGTHFGGRIENPSGK